MNMQAAWYEQYGPAEEVLTVGKKSIPEVQENEVLIRLYTSGINPSDVKRRNGVRVRDRSLNSFIIPHSDGAGIIEKVGSRVSPQRIGERVWVYNAQWQRSWGTAAEYIALPTELALPLPDYVSFAEGACLGIPAMTAYHSIFADGSVQGKTVLVTGGAGSVGYYAVQMAKWGGATVIATVSNSEKADYAKQAGADFILNYREENLEERIMQITRNAGVDCIIEVDFGGNLALSQKILKLNGVISAYASMGNPTPQIPFYDLMFKGATLRLVNVYDLPTEARNRAIQDIHTMLKTKALTHIIAARFRLNEIISAHQYVEKGNHIGNVILDLRE